MGRSTPEWVAPTSWQTIDFISDLHLAEDTPNTFAAWAAYMGSTSADAVFVLGDLFEAWPGDDARHAGFEACCGKVLREAAATKVVAFMVGNRDFLVGAEALADWGLTALADPTVLVAFGKRMLLSHGDELCIADVDYQQVRRMVRNPAWQADVLAKPLALRRVMAQQMRSDSAQHQRQQSPAESFDVDQATAVQWMKAAAAPTLVHGHTHRPGGERYTPDFGREVLSDWDLDHAQAPRAEVLRWRIDSLARIPASQAGARG